MIAVDTSSLVVYLTGGTGSDIDLVDRAILSRELAIPPVVLAEVMSDPARGEAVGALLTPLPLLELSRGYWHRAGLLRARVLAGGFKARLGDALVAQCCLDHDVPLITRDRDFRHFVRLGLTVLP
jgi:predicted nucleic acid-binding protein